MSRKSSRNGFIVSMLVGAPAAVTSYFLFKDEIKKSASGRTKKDSPIKSIIKPKMARYPSQRAKGRPKGTGSQTDRIKKIIFLINEKKEFSLSQIRYRFPAVTERTLRRDLDKLERDGKIVKKGNTRSTIYLKP